MLMKIENWEITQGFSGFAKFEGVGAKSFQTFWYINQHFRSYVTRIFYQIFDNYCFRYRKENNKPSLVVSIIKCQNLPCKDPENPMLDPYVKLQLLPDKQHKVKTRVLRKTRSPVYEEDFSFYGIKPNQLQVWKAANNDFTYSAWFPLEGKTKILETFLIGIYMFVLE